MGAELGLRHTWVDRDGFKAAIGLNAGAFNGSEAPVMGDLAPGTEYASVGGRYVEIPATFSIHKGDNVAVFFGPVAHYFNVLRIESVSSSDAQEDAHLFAHRGRFWQTGAFIGACLSGKTLQLTPGVTVYLEPDKYPVRNFLGGAVRPYPWVGITVLARSKKP